MVASSGWMASFANTASQGNRFAGPLSTTNQYYGFLSKADFDPESNSWDLFFELVSKEWLDNALLKSPITIVAPLKASPALLFHVPSAAQSDIVTILQLESADQIAEATWFLLTLSTKLSTKPRPLSGELVDAEIDIPDAGPPNELDFGQYFIKSGSPIAFPTLDKYNNLTLKPATSTMEVEEQTQKLANTFRVVAQTMEVEKPSDDNTQIVAVNINDVGQGNCNLLIDNNQEAVLYYDLGRPIPLYVGSVPPMLVPPFPNPGGPIEQNQANNLEVVLSHWDWDHYALGRFGTLRQLRWVVPQQVTGPAARNFQATLPNCVVWPNNLAFHQVRNVRIIRCVPPPNAAGAFLLNNSGLAISIVLQLPTADVNPHAVYLTGDANFNTLAAGVNVNPTGILAAHHGSVNNGASANLPAPDANYPNAGRIAYSYGVRNGDYVYNFPNPVALQNYRNAGWTVEQSTAQGMAIRANNAPGQANTANRGNIRVGDQTQLNNAYANTAFFALPNVLN